MIEVYRNLPFEQAASYRELFLRIAGGRLPLLFHCTAGKDRTGVAAALLLSAIGVPRRTILSDYLFTNEFMTTLVPFLERDSRYGAFLRKWRAVVTPLLRAEPEYIEAMFEAVATRHGGVEAYARDALSLHESVVPAIRTALLEPPPALP
jgi:protein-tyrosine phosphatase